MHNFDIRFNWLAFLPKYALIGVSGKTINIFFPPPLESNKVILSLILFSEKVQCIKGLNKFGISNMKLKIKSDIRLK